MEDWRKYIPLYLRLVRGFFLYPCFLLIWACCMLTMSAFFTEAFYLHLTAALFTPFVFFSVARVFSEQDKAGIATYVQGGTEGIWQRALVVLRSRGFLIDLGFVLGSILLLPFEAGFYNLSRVLDAGRALSRFGIKGFVLLIALPLFSLLLLWARLSAWQKHADDTRRHPGSEQTGPDLMTDTIARARWGAHSMGQGFADVNTPTGTIDATGRAFLRREEDNKHLVLRLLGLLAIYAFGGFGILALYPVAISVFAILGKMTTIRWWLPIILLGGLIGGFWLWQLLRALRIRRRFFKNLKRLCREYGFHVEGMKRPYASLFRYRDGVNFTVYANGKGYDCKLFGALRRHFELFFDEKGTLRYRRTIRFRRVELLSFTSVYDFDFESAHKKICLVVPVPKVISAGNEQWNRPIDTGVRVGDYRIFSASGFLNALKRDCVEKD